MSIVLSSPGSPLSATFEPAAGMLCSSLCDGEQELLDQRRGLDDYRERGKTMGVPLLYPWANRLAGRELDVAGRRVMLPEPGTVIGADDHGLPIHGAIPGLMRWAAQRAEPAQVRALLSWEGEPLLAVFPFAHTVCYEASLEEAALTITVTVRADRGDPVPVSFGFHPYLRLPDPSRGGCRISLPPGDHLALDQRSIPTGEREPFPARAQMLGTSAWDDGFALAQAARFEIGGEQGTLSVELLEGYTYGQVFSPSTARFICFEPMTAPANALCSGDGLRVLEPGREHRARFRISARAAARRPPRRERRG